jgi:hypothetical protein
MKKPISNLAISQSIEQFDNMLCIINSLSQPQFSLPLDALSNSSIGMHIRHIVEFYACFLHGNQLGYVDYDARKRDPNIESFKVHALSAIQRLKEEIMALDCIDIELKTTQGVISSNTERELFYNAEHCIHHYFNSAAKNKSLNQL